MEESPALKDHNLHLQPEEECTHLSARIRTTPNPGHPDQAWAYSKKKYSNLKMYRKKEAFYKMFY